MRQLNCQHLVMLAVLALASPAAAQQRYFPPDPAEVAKEARISELIGQGHQEERIGNVPAAIAKLQDACVVEATRSGGFFSWARLMLARTYLRAGRDAEAIEAYKHVFAWNSAKGDLEPGFGDFVKYAMEFAILLAKTGRPQEAKAMYYFGLRNFNPFKERPIEPIPFLTVFAPEEEGESWEYTPERLEAAALMIQIMEGGMLNRVTHEETSAVQLAPRVRELAPDWFYPYLYRAAQGWNSEQTSSDLALAQALARTSVEREVVELYRRQLAEHKALLEAADLAPSSDLRPMKEGAERRARMQCLRPNEQVLRRISIDLPGG
ncbi:MAG: hypothetical protein M9921_13235 [Fimbriimonadaceae bacterium]|nr:hypothetical protein [Fimbriimonadaceae bacterium]